MIYSVKNGFYTYAYILDENIWLCLPNFLFVCPFKVMLERLKEARVSRIHRGR